MSQAKVPDPPTPKTIKYANLLGVDYRADQTEVDRKRSPDMVNMISDRGGDPIKRHGYRSVGNAYKGMVTSSGEVWGVRVNATGGIVCANLNLSGINITEHSTKIITISGYDFTNKVHSVFGFQHYVLITTSIAVILVDVDTLSYKITGIVNSMMSTGTLGESTPTTPSIVPETTIALKPDGTNGESYEEKNLFSIYQRATYIGDGTSVEYIIPAYQKIGNWVKCEIMDANGDWQVTTDYSLGTSTTADGKSLDGTGTITSNIVDAKVTFNTAPSAPVVAGQPNVRITFAPYSTEQIGALNRGFYNETFVKLLSSQAATIFSQKLFLADDERAYYSDTNQQLRFGDNHWFDVDNNIVSFTRTSAYLAVITKDNGRNTIFLADDITESITGQVAFAVKPSNAGVGSIAPKCTGVLNDEPVFLANTGVYGILTNFQSEKYAMNRSGRINKELCTESDLYNAVGIPFNNYYFLAINRKMYVLDSRHKDTQKTGENSYECYFFDSMPFVLDMFVADNKMYFTDATHTYRWNDDLPAQYKYLDNAVYVPPVGTEPEKWTGDPVKAKWCTTFDDDGYPQRLKTYSKKGSMITLKPNWKSGCDITLCKDGDTYEYVGHFDTSLTSFVIVDFNEGKFSFKSNLVGSDIFPRKKIKKYKRLQIIIENNDALPFGVTSVTKTFTIGNLTKR